MADGVNLPPAGTGDTGVKASTQKVTADSSDVQDVSLTSVVAGVRTRNPTIPVSGPVTDAQLRATPVPVSGTVTASGPLTDAQLRATPVPVSGTVTATPTGTQAVSHAIATQADGHSANIGLLADASSASTLTGLLKAIKAAITGTVAVSGTFWQATQPVSGTVTASGPVTDAQLRATPVPVSGTVTTTPPSNASSNVAQINGVTPLMGTGNTGTGSLRVTVATDQAALTNALKVDPSAVTSPVSLASVPSHAVTNAGTFAVQNTAATPAGSNNIGDVDVLTLPALPAGSNNIGDVDIASSVVLPVSDNAGSLTVDAPVGTPVAVRISDGTSFQQGIRTDNQAFTDGSSMVTPGGYLFDEVAGTALTENDAAAARIDAKRAQVFVTEDATTRGQRAAVDAAGAQLVNQSKAATGAAPSAFTATTSTQVFASNASRKLFTVSNDSDQILYLMLAAAAASATSYHVKVSPGGFFSTTDYSGEIRGIMGASITTGQVNPGEYT